MTFDDVGVAARRLQGVVHRTPVVTSRTFDARFGTRCYFKCENLQRAGSFKIRGAYNALSSLSEAERRRGVLTYSSGNHAQALALAGKLLGSRVAVVMPADASLVKLEATRGYGAEVITYDRRDTTREEVGAKIAAARGLSIVPPYDHPDVVAGQGTAALELIEDVGTLDMLLACCGGGGLLSGSALAARTLLPDCRVVGVEPERADDATRSFRTGVLHRVSNPDTIADGARTPSLGNLTFPLVRTHVHDMSTVSEGAIMRAMHFLWQRMKLVVEPTGAVATAALFDGAVANVPERIGIILSGGNVELLAVARLFEAVEACT